MKIEPLKPEACGDCSGCRNSGNDPWKCRKPWGVGKILGPLQTWYDPATGLKRAKSFGDSKGYSRSFDMDTGEIYESKDQRSNGWFGDGWNGGGKGKDYKQEKCAHSHPPLTIQDGFTVYGGAASSPVVKDCDIYVSLDAYAGAADYVKAYPWNEGGPTFICFPITDMQVPKDVAEFKKMIVWLKEQGLAGKKIHIGCVGGHGRTGTLLAALVKEVTGNVDAISFVRKNYCDKAVESDVQARFLAKEFGIKEEKGHKTYSGSAAKPYYHEGKGYTVEKPSQTSKFNDRYRDLFKGKEITLPIDPMVRKGSIWSKE